MTSIGGPGGIGGPNGPRGPGDVQAPAGVDETASTEDVGEAARAKTAHAPDLAALSADVAAGRLTAREAIERLVDATATPDMGAAERAELRELLTDLVANDPYLGALANRV